MRLWINNLPVEKMEDSSAEALLSNAVSSGCLLEQPEHVLLRLRGERQCCRRELLPGLQGQQVGALFVAVRQGERVGADLKGVDHRLGEVLADLHRCEV